VRDNLEPLLSVRNLETHFQLDEGTVVAVDRASFDIRPGETLGIVGESGCGKSVTARSILGILDAPGVVVGGEALLAFGGPNDPKGGDRQVIDLLAQPAYGETMCAIRGDRIALVFQEPMASFSPVHRIGTPLTEVIRLHRKVSGAQARAIGIEALRQVGIPHPEQRIDTYPFELSGGLRQRAMIAIALACEPSLLIADEPTTALDVTTQAQILDLLRALQERHGMAIMLITHDLGVIAEMVDNVVVMYLGRVVERGPVDAIFHDPRHPYTKALLASIPSVTAPSGQLLASISGNVPHPQNRPAGCPFHPRCPAFMPGICDAADPAEVTVGERHAVSCFLYPEPERAT
jgi:peptide/nickel transport system ATP-binding protein